MGRWLIVVIFPMGLGACLYLHDFAQLFPLVEYRQWLEYPVSALGTVEAFFDWQSLSNRNFPLLAVFGIASVCGTSYVCSNVILILVMLAAALFMVMAVGVLVGWRHAIAGGVAIALLIFSEPWINNASWQATALDKFGALFTALATLIFAIALRLQFWPRVVIGNSLVLAAVVIAFNSKEAAWVVLPSLIVLGTLSERRCGWRHAIASAVTTLALPIVYGAFIFARLVKSSINLTSTDPGHMEHVLGGSGIDNFGKYVAYLSNGSPPIIVGGLLLVIVLLGARNLRSDYELITVAAWALTSLALALIPPLFTLYGSPFYLIIPSLYLGALVFAVLAAAFDERDPIRNSAVAACVVLLCTQHLYRFTDRLALYRQVAAASDHFVAALPEVARATRGGSSPILAVYPKPLYFGYMFVDGGKLGRYVFGVGPEADSFDQRFSYKTFENSPNEIAADGSVRLIYDGQMRLTAILEPTAAPAPASASSKAVITSP